MNLNLIGKLAGVLLLVGSLSACLDATVDVDVTSQTTARASLTQVMSADVYAMVTGNAEAGGDQAGGDSFCNTGELSEHADGSASCTLVQEGPFSAITLDESESPITFTPAGPKLVRVVLSLASMKGDMGGGDMLDPETRQMMEAFFSGHTITVRFSGAEVVDSNMTISADKTSAQQIVPFPDLINGSPKVPNELYAVVRVQ